MPAPRLSRTAWLALAGVGLALACAVSFAAIPAQTPTAAARPGLSAFRSDAELRAFLKARRVQRREYLEADAMAAPPPPASGAAVSESVVTAERAPANPSITNTQEADVDEGDIVKVSGEILVILRRGRLFTVSMAGGDLKAIDAINAYPPGVDARDDWYDEMLVSGDRIVVIGYSYSRGGTEINRFRVSAAGRLTFEDAYQLRSNDYYSDRNYASRLVGHRLVFYTPLSLYGWDSDPLEVMPALRRWSGQTGRGEGFRRIAGATHIYIPPMLRNAPIPIEALHSVTTCDLTAPVLDCEAMGVLGPASRSFYVSSQAVYVWLSTPWYPPDPRRHASAIVYRLPLDGSRPSAVGARGAPVDQFAFREDRQDGVLNVLVRSQGEGDAMWRPEFSSGAVALARIPLGAFGDGSREVAAVRYRPLPHPDGNDWAFHERFVGDYVLYGQGADWSGPREHGALLTVVPVRGGPVSGLSLAHGVDRIEALGRDAVVVGSDAHDLTFTAVELTAGPPHVGDAYQRAAASEAETRSHGFFFSPRSADGVDGVLGLPIARAARPAYRQLFETSASMVFLRRQDRRFKPLGELPASDEGAADDACQASCVDWYGNARPIFLGRRTFALLGYELVEGDVRTDRIVETRRISFAPGGPLLTHR